MNPENIINELNGDHEDNDYNDIFQLHSVSLVEERIKNIKS